jgi:hypothetical protein
MTSKVFDGIYKGSFINRLFEVKKQTRRNKLLETIYNINLDIEESIGYHY